MLYLSAGAFVAMPFVMHGKKWSQPLRDTAKVEWYRSKMNCRSGSLIRWCDFTFSAVGNNRSNLKLYAFGGRHARHSPTHIGTSRDDMGYGRRAHVARQCGIRHIAHIREIAMSCKAVPHMWQSWPQGMGMYPHRVVHAPCLPTGSA